MIEPRALRTLIDNSPSAPFDRYALEGIEARWPSLGSPYLPVVNRDASGRTSALLTLPTDLSAASCVEVRDITYFVRLLIPLVRPGSPLSTAQAIDLGDLLGIALSALARQQGRTGPYALLQATTRHAYVGDFADPLSTLWRPAYPSIGTARAIACIALSRGLAPAARRALQTSGTPVRWRRACSIAARPHGEQLALIAVAVGDRAAGTRPRGES